MSMTASRTWWFVTGQSNAGLVAWILVLCLPLGSCYRRDVNETTLGTIGRAAIHETAQFFTKSQYDAKEDERASTALALAATRTQLAAETAQREAAEQRATAMAKADVLHRQELDKLKADRETLHEHLANITTTGVMQACPLGNAERTVAVWNWLRDQRGPARHTRRPSRVDPGFASQAYVLAGHGDT